MLNKLSGWDDTIVALATVPGISAIGVIRLSGPDAIRIASELFPSKDLEKQASHTLHVGILKLNEEPIDEVVVSIFKGPKSYTGENIIEISSHGSPYVQQQVIQACIAKGARLARAGEFTQRAFLNGKLDLTQAEAVADLIISNSKASQRTALNNVRGGFSKILKELRENLIQFSALLELELDFSQEDVEFADRGKFIRLIDSAIASTRQLMDSFDLGNVIRDGITVAIIGKPNAGKSTLLNALLNEERAIVSDIAGTTRDTIEETLNIKGIVFRLIDTAGIRNHTSDKIEAFGIERSLEKMKTADLVLYIFDSTDMDEEELQSIKIGFENDALKYLLVANKTDRASSPNAGVVSISAKNNIGIEELKSAIYERSVNLPSVSEDVIITNSRHQEGLRSIHQSLLEIKEGLHNNIPGDLLALNIRHCLQSISELTGDVTNDSVLDYVFSKFCIGK